MGKLMDEKEFTEGKEPFVGTILTADFPCECRSCKAGEENSKFGHVDQMHLTIEPSTVYTATQHEWYSGNKVGSTMHRFMSALAKAGIDIKDSNDLEDRVFLFNNTLLGKKRLWIVKKELSKKELRDAMKAQPDNVDV